MLYHLHLGYGLILGDFSYFEAEGSLDIVGESYFSLLCG